MPEYSMPYVSTAQHGQPYQEPADLAAKLSLIARLLEEISRSDLYPVGKKRMLNHAIWLVTEAAGNFYGRYRSASVVEKIGQPIQRDHVFPRADLVKELLRPDCDGDAIVERSCCCIVTKAEHQKLNRFDESFTGWCRYREAEIKVIDMLTGEPVN